jgi:glycosyltransferase involved in cell wall biosynthesis
VPALSIVFPAYNEARRLPATLEKVYAWLDARKIAAEVLVVDDGSKDGTAEIATGRFGARPGFRVLSYGGNRGKGYAVRHGFLAATGDRVLMSDSDLSTPIEELDHLAAAMDAKKLDIAIGSRALGTVVVAQRGMRSFSGKIYNAIMRSILWLPFHDTQCGFKLFAREKCKPVFEAMRIERFSFDVEILFLAKKRGLTAAEVPVRWFNDEETKVRFWRDATRMFTDVVRIRWWSVIGKY